MHTKIVLALFMAAASIMAACSESETPSEASTPAAAQAPNPTPAEPASNLKQIQQQRSGDYFASLLNESGQLKQGPNQLTLEFHNASNHELTAVENVQITSSMVMPGTAPMVGTASVKPAGTAGRYDLSVDLGKMGQWDVVVTFDNGQKVQFGLKAQ